MRIRHLGFIGVALALTACGGGGPGSPAAIVEVCEAQLNVPPGLCDCVGDESKDLSAAERRFVVASLNKDSKATEVARNELSFTEITRAGMFFLTATQTCSANIPE